MKDLEPLPPSLARTWGNTETMGDRMHYSVENRFRGGETPRAPIGPMLCSRCWRLHPPGKCQLPRPKD